MQNFIPDIGDKIPEFEDQIAESDGICPEHEG